MGSRGPLPRRDEQRRRRSSEQVDTAPAGGPDNGPVWPAPAEGWHSIAAAWYRSLAASGQARFYEPSDVAAALYVAEAMSRSLAGTRMSGQAFQAVMSAMSDLLATEGARRRMRLELERVPAEAPPSVAIMAEYREAAATAEDERPPVGKSGDNQR